MKKKVIKEQAVGVAKHQQMEEVLLRCIQESTTLNKLSRSVNSKLSFNKMVQSILEESAASTNSDLTLLFLRDGDNLNLQGFGPKNSKFRHESTPMHRLGECLCGLAVSNGKPIYSYDIQNDPMCTWEECKKAGLRSFAALPLKDGKRILGVLGFASGTKKRDFSINSKFLEAISEVTIIGLKNYLLYKEISEHDKKLTKKNEELINENKKRKLAEEKINASLNEKEVLLREIHHRVKNNMQVISSLLELQSRSLKDKNLVGVLEEGQNRIKAMSMIHEKLYRSENLASINFGEYIKNLANDLFKSYKMSVARVALKMELSDITIDINSVVPCGLIVNELITNSLKHAFPDRRKGEIKISLHKNEDAEIELVFSDNGVGIPEDIDYRNTDSMGLRLIFNLTEHQLGGKVELDRSRGTEFRITFKEVK